MKKKSGFGFKKKLKLNKRPFEGWGDVEEGDVCPKCELDVLRKKIPNPNRKKSRNYFYHFYFKCPRCRTMYMPPEQRYGGVFDEIQEMNNHLRSITKEGMWNVPVYLEI